MFKLKALLPLLAFAGAAMISSSATAGSSYQTTGYLENGACSASVYIESYQNSSSYFEEVYRIPELSDGSSMSVSGEGYEYSDDDWSLYRNYYVNWSYQFSCQNGVLTVNYQYNDSRWGDSY